MLALRTGNQKFLSQSPCRKFRHLVWTTGSALPRMEHTTWDNKNECYVCYTPLKQAVGWEKTCSRCRIREKLPPSLLAVFKLIGWIIFLLMYGIFLLSVFDKNISYGLEGALWLFIITFILEHLVQFTKSPIKSYHLKSNFFEILEIFSVFFFIVAWIARYNAFLIEKSKYWLPTAHILFGIDFVAFCLCPLELCYTSEFLGPLILTVAKMLKTLMRFLLLVLIISFAYAVASESVLYPKAKISWKRLSYLFRKAFWAMFGEFFFNELITTDPAQVDCTDNPSVYNSYDIPRCISDVGRYFLPPLLGSYFFVVNLLLFNLLIALFNCGEDIQRRLALPISVAYMKYYKAVFLPPPFTILFPFLLYCHTGKRDGSFYQEEIVPTELLNLQRMEASGRFKFIQDKEDRQKSVVCNGVIQCPHKDQTKILYCTSTQTCMFSPMFKTGDRHSSQDAVDDLYTTESPASLSTQVNDKNSVLLADAVLSDSDDSLHDHYY